MTLFCPAKEFYSLYQDIGRKAERMRLQVKGGSMYPLIQSGDWINLVPLSDPAATIRRGEVILFRKDDNLYLHRVIRDAGDHVIPKGDMSSCADGAIPKKDILAKVISVDRREKNIDLTSAKSLFLSDIAAKISPFMRYPLSLLRILSRIPAAILSRVQAVKVYRLTAKKIIKPHIFIRDATPEDEEGMRDLYLMNGADMKIGVEATRKEGFWLVAEMGKKIVGGLTITRHEKDPAKWVIFGLEVKSLFRGLGIGDMLVRKALEKAGDGGSKEIGLFVKIKSGPAIELYTKLGFISGVDIPSGFVISEDELYLSYKFKA